MSEKSLFFNAIADPTSPTGYDKNYNADDISDWLSVVWENGVVKTNTVNNEPTGLKVEANNDMTIKLNIGRAAIKGKAYINKAIKTFNVTANGTNANRYDYVVIKYDNNVSAREIKAELRTGTSAKPTAAVLAQNKNNGDANIYELMLAYIEVAPNTNEITQSAIKDTRADINLCGWFTPVKGYEDYYDAVILPFESNKTVASTTTTIITDLQSSLYNNKYSLIDVYTNGLLEPKSAYTVSLSGGYIVVTFTAQKSAGAKITVKLSNFIDGEGMSTALAQYTQLLQDVANLNAAGEYNYICNGVNDNILLSTIVREIYSTNDYKSFKINVIGNIGVTAPFGGDGTSASPYSWFNFINPLETNRIVTVDFTRSSEITPTITNGTYNVIFRTSKINIIGANVIASNTTTGTNIRISNASSGAIKYENCRFWLTAYQDSIIAPHGTFTNCRGSVANIINNSYCFNVASTGLLRLNGGEYYAYAGDANVQSAVVGQSTADAVSVLYGVSAPTLARSGFSQKNSIVQYVSGGILNCTDLISELPSVVVSGISNIRGTIAKSKTNVW